MTGLTIRAAAPTDAEAIARLFIRARTECLPFLNWVYDEPFMVSLFARRIGDDETFLIAEAEGEIIGFIRFKADKVDDLYVLPRHHRIGVGSALLGRAKAGAGPELRLWVFQVNKQARDFYERHGFELEYETDGANNMEKCPDARYVWRNPGACNDPI